MAALSASTLIATIILPYAVLSCNLVVHVGDNVSISCHDNLLPISRADWVFSRPSKVPNELDICTDTACRSRYHADEMNNFQLSMQLVNKSDSGTYTCITYETLKEHRHPTELCVNERMILAQGPGPPTTVNMLTLSFTTTSTTDWWHIGVIAGTTVGFTIIVALVVIVLMLRKRTDRWPCSTGAKHDAETGRITADAEHLLAREILERGSEPEPLQIEENTSKVQLLEEYDKNIEPQEVSEVQKPQHQTDVIHVADTVFVIDDARALIAALLLLYRLLSDGGNHSDPAKTAFEFLTKTCAMWLNKLTERKQRVRRLLYYERSGYKRRPKRLPPNELTSSSPVMALAILNGHVYTIHRESNMVHAGSSGDRSIVVKGMKFPVDMVACSSANVLYIADELQRCIWLVSPDGKSMKWNDTGELQPRTLSLTSGSLLVTTDSSALLRYSDTKQMTIKLPENVEPYHAVETPDKTFVVCCRRARGNQVLEVGFDGQELRQFVKTAQMLRSPKYIVMDQAGRLLVADFGNSRILLLDSKLTHCCVILDHQRDSIEAPNRLCLDENTGQLIVVRWPSHSARGFDVKNISVE